MIQFMVFGLGFWRFWVGDGFLGVKGCFFQKFEKKCECFCVIMSYSHCLIGLVVELFAV